MTRHMTKWRIIELVAAAGMLAVARDVIERTT